MAQTAQTAPADKPADAPVTPDADKPKEPTLEERVAALEKKVAPLVGE